MSLSATRPSFFQRFIFDTARKFIKARRARRQLQEMLHMSDHLLADIGLTRFDVAIALRCRDSIEVNKSLSQAAAAKLVFSRAISKSTSAPVGISEPMLRAA